MIGSRVGSRSTLVGSAVGSGTDDEGVSDLLLIGFAGQSNEVGFADIDGVNNINQYYGNQYSAVLLRQQDGTNANPPVWTFYASEGVKPRTNSATLNMGPELSCARYLNRRHANRWRFSKIGIGSTGLNDHWRKLAAYPTVPPNLFQQHITAHQLAESEFGARLSAYVWIQGEQDATDAADAAAYEANLTQFIADVRLVWPDIPFVIVKLHILNPSPHRDTVRAAQVAVAGAVAGVTLIDADALPLQGDNLHYTSEGYLALGDLIGQAVLSALTLTTLLPAFVTTYKGRTIDVTDASSADGSSLTDWDWDWGDGTLHDTTQDASHTYAEDTPRTIVLTVTNALGRTATVSQLVRPVLPTWTVDATSLKGAPASSAEWTNLIAAHGLNWTVPQHLWTLQSAGNQTDVIGGKTLTAGGSPGTQQAVVDWTRLAVGHSGAASNQTFNNVTMANINASSVIAGGYLKYNSSAAIRQIMFHGQVSGNAMEGSAGTQKGRLRNGASTGASTLDWTGVVMPFWLVYNRATNENILVTPIELIRVPFVAQTGAEFRLTVGVAADTAADVQGLYAVDWEGEPAQRSLSDILALFRALGWPVTLPGD